MYQYLSKLLPNFVYPLGMACLLLIGALVIKGETLWSKRLTLAALLVLMIGGNAFVSTSIVYTLEKQYPPQTKTPQAEVILVLGGGTRHQSPPRIMAEVNEAGDRLLYAAKLYRAGAAPYILVSGGNSKWSGATTGTEAEAMSEILQLAGVPGSAILMEDTSINTYENGIYSFELLQRLQINKVLLVTSALHMPRSMLVFSALDLEVTPAATDFSVTYAELAYLHSPDIRIQIMNLIPTVNNLRWTSLAMKEYLGILMYRIQKWI